MKTIKFISDMDRLREFYDGAVGFKPGGESTVRLREEDLPNTTDS